MRPAASRQREALGDHGLEPLLGDTELGAELRAVLERVREVAEVGLGGVVQQRGHQLVRRRAALLEQVADDRGVLGDRVEGLGVAAEAAQVRQRAGDVGGVDVLDGRVERVHPAAGEGLDERAGLEHRVMVGAAGGRTWRPPVARPSCQRLAPTRTVLPSGSTTRAVADLLR